MPRLAARPELGWRWAFPIWVAAVVGAVATWAQLRGNGPTASRSRSQINIRSRTDVFRGRGASRLDGALKLDVDSATWLELPWSWRPETWPDAEAWASDVVEGSFSGWESAPSPYVMETLKLELQRCAEVWGPNAVEADRATVGVFLYLPYPYVPLFAVRVCVIEGEAAQEQKLMFHAGANLPASRAVRVEDFATPALGSGIRVRRHFRGADKKERLALSHAWRRGTPPTVLVIEAQVDKEAEPGVWTAVEAFLQSARWSEGTADA